MTLASVELQRNLYEKLLPLGQLTCVLFFIFLKQANAKTQDIFLLSFFTCTYVMSAAKNIEPSALQRRSSTP